MKTLGTKVNDEVYNLFVERCKERGTTVSEKLREIIKGEGKLSDSFNFDITFEHMRKCVKCQNALIDNGYVLASIEMLKKFNLIIEKKPVLM